MRTIVGILALALLLPVAAAGPGYCPRGGGNDPVQCHDKLGSPGQDHLVVYVRPLMGEAHAGVYEPTKLDPGEEVATVGYERYGRGVVGEEVLLAYARCPPYGADELCTPSDVFAGGHLAPEGHDARVWFGSDWTSAGASYGTRVADHDVAAQVGTFHFWMLQYVYVEAFVDGERYGFFEAVPAPLP